MQKSDRVLLMTWSSIPRNYNRAHIPNDENRTQFKYKMNINRMLCSLSNTFPVLLSFLGQWSLSWVLNSWHSLTFYKIMHEIHTYPMRPSRINCINSYYFLYLLNVLLLAMLNAFNYGKWECFKIPHSGVKCFEKSLGDISLPLITSPKLCLSGSLQWKQSLHIAMKNSAVIWLIAVKWRIAL